MLPKDKSPRICLAHGGPFAQPEDTEYLYRHTDAAGFVGASSIERIPIENAVIEAVKNFKSYKTGK
ncbi:MAG: phosphoenolpyruvate hydrolase family protein [Actinomycetota bacterium]|nr:phosphoenolpyruvate hydrolase family protein [Actinomycetota bacterium]